MAELTEKGREVLDRYLKDVQDGLEAQGGDLEEILADLRDHVHAALEHGPQPAGEAAVEEVLAQLGDPRAWTDASRPEDIETRGAKLTGWGLGVFALTVAGVALFPWLGPLVLLAAWIAARAVLARADRVGGPTTALRWLVVPAIVLAVGGVVLLVAVGPLFILADLGASQNAVPAWVVAFGGLILWWLLLFLGARFGPRFVRLVAYPLLGRPSSTGMAALLALGVLAVAAGGVRAQDPLDGLYGIEAEMGGRVMTGTIAVRHDSGEVGGQVRLGGLPPVEIVSGRMAGDTVRLELAFPEGPGSAWWVPGPDGSLSGVLAVGGNRVPFTGVRRPEPEAGTDGPAVAFLSTARDTAPALLGEAGEPGLGIAVVGDSTVGILGVGMADPALGTPVTDSTLFQLGSISKTLTAWGVMRLVEEGRLELDAPASRYLERWSLPAADYGPDGVTIRRLLSHTAGINVPSISGVDLDERIPSIVEELNGRGNDERRVRATLPPGETFAYSGGGYMILQLVVEDVTGEPFDRYMADHVLRPLGMTTASFAWNDTVARRVAMPTSPDSVRDRRHRLFAGVAGAGLYASPADMASFLAAHFPGPHGDVPGRGVISPDALTLLMTPDAVAGVYGLGYEVYAPVAGHPVVGHAGSNVGWKANFLVVPDLEVGVAVLSNADLGVARAALMDLAWSSLMGAR